MRMVDGLPAVMADRTEWRRHGGMALAVMLLGLPNAAEAAHWRLHTLYSFCSTGNEDCAVGLPDPTGNVVVDRQGNVYGTTQSGGLQHFGEVFEVSRGSETVLHSFCAEANCTDGQTPIAGLLRDAAGNLYGTTQTGGPANEISGPGASGTVYEVSPRGGETVLYTFGQLPGRADGGFPSGGVNMDGAGNLVGTTDKGGANDGGVVYVLGKDGGETVLYDFCADVDCVDGNQPVAAPVVDASGNVYGTTFVGGAKNQGTVFEVFAGGSERVLHHFCSAAACADGQNPIAGLIIDASGNLYGTASGGGRLGNGTVFEVTAAGRYKILHRFSGGPDDGRAPTGGVVRDRAGNLYGATEGGGSSNQGIVFEITAAGKEQVIYDFCESNGCPDGSGPYGGLAIDGSGNLYGTTREGGSAQGGTVFELLHP